MAFSVTVSELQQFELRSHQWLLLGLSTPSQVASNIIRFLKSRKTHWFISVLEEDILAQAHESTVRYSKGEPLSILDGVPFSLKDTADAKPYRTTCGTAYYGTW